jgi:perosamine synthetase
MIPIYTPYLNKEILKYAHNALDSTWISSKGEYVCKVEDIFSKNHSISDFRINSALTCSNGTTAMHLVAKVLKKAHPLVTKIIVPNNVYVASWNAFLYDKEFTLEVVETDLNTWNYDLDKLYDKLSIENLETTALLVVHNLGNILDVPKIQRDWKGIIVVEDNCEGLTGKYDGKPSGSMSLASAVSFFGNKTITSGEGGIVVAADKWKSYLYKLRGQGQTTTRYIHDELGYNYRMTNVQAALLLGQIEKINEIKEMKKRVFSLYKNFLCDITEILIQEIDPNTVHSNWMFGVRIIGNESYEKLEEFMNKNCVEIRPMFYHIHTHEHLKNIPIFGGDKIAHQISKECVMLPSYPELQDHEISHICNLLKQYVKSIGSK